jgi:hypothetical protein
MREVMREQLVGWVARLIVCYRDLVSGGGEGKDLAANP